MTTIVVHHIGSADPLVLKPRQPDGTRPNLLGLTVELRVTTATACLTLPAPLRGDGFEVDLGGLDVPPGRYKAAVWCDDGAVWRWSGDFVLRVKGGC